MDIARPEFKRQKRRRQAVLIVIVLVVVVAVAVGVSRLRPAASSVEQFGEPATIDTHNGISGTVMRGRSGGTKRNGNGDVKLISELPQGARPDLSMDGTIDLGQGARIGELDSSY
jgi:hypothetical protein